MENINVGMDDMRVQGFLSLDGAHSKVTRPILIGSYVLLMFHVSLGLPVSL